MAEWMNDWGGVLQQAARAAIAAADPNNKPGAAVAFYPAVTTGVSYKEVRTFATYADAKEFVRTTKTFSYSLQEAQ